MMLHNKNALILGASGAVGSAVARRLTADGAHVFLAGRTESALESLAAELHAPWERVDGTDEAAVTAWVNRVARQGHGIDVMFNAIGPRPIDADYATSSIAISYERFALPLNLIAGSQFLTARAAARHMVPRGRGAIVFLSASLTGQFIPYMSGITAACGAVEALSRTLATEFGPAGVRVNCVRAGGMPETRTIAETMANMAATMGVQTDEAARPTTSNVLRRSLRVEETAAAVAWVASDLASGVAGQVVNVCAGAIVSR
jgi:NAD(P)-dependent dehydrogenase (short-subunit alcohol dehydrogenase family)